MEINILEMAVNTAIVALSVCLGRGIFVAGVYLYDSIIKNN